MKACLLTLLLICCALPALAGQKVAAPDIGVYHCAHPSSGARDDEITARSIAELRELTGRGIVWAYLSHHWDRGMIFPSEACDELHRAGIVPLVGMMPWSQIAYSRREELYSLDRIISGWFDREIAGMADAVRALGYPIMIEFGPECNGSWFPWSGTWNGADEDSYGERGIPDGPERFRDAYRHIIDVFRERGAADVTWVFHIDARPHPRERWNSASFYYPGDEYIDWVGFSAYGRRRPDAPAEPFDRLITHAVRGLAALAPQKPIAVLEIGVAESDDPDEKARWIRDAYRSIADGELGDIRAVSWWHKPVRFDGTLSGMEIDSSPQALEAYRTSVSELLDEPMIIDLE